MYKRISNEANGVKYRDVRVEPNNKTNYLEVELMNYDLEQVLNAIKHVFNIDLAVIKKEGATNES